MRICLNPFDYIRPHDVLFLFFKFQHTQTFESTNPSIYHIKQDSLLTVTIIMSPTIFVTGVSGYIGGHIVTDLIKKHSEYQVITLVRTEKQAEIIKATWPAVKTVLGDLDNHDLLVEQGKRADVVLRMS